MSTTEKPILNKEVFENITNGDSEFKNELINIFISSTKEQIAEIKEVAKSSNSNQYQWYSVLHSLKGSCSSVGAVKLSEFIIENQNKDEGYEKEERIRIYEEIKSLLEETNDAILSMISN